MSMIMPDLMLHRVTGITAEALRERGVRALFLDVDNTLTTHNNPDPDPAIRAWLGEMDAAGIRLVLVSNNSAARVAPFAQTLGLAFTARAWKPLPVGFFRAAKALSLRPEQTAVVGDQLFTDILGGRLFGGTVILVEPMEPETGPLFRFKRRLERRVLAGRRYE